MRLKLIALMVAAGLAASQAHAQPQWKPAAYDAMGAEKTTREAGGIACTIFRPKILTAGSPIVLWGNGTGQMPDTYGAILKTLASNGFVVAAANTPNAGSGQDMLGCLDWLTAENAREGSPYADKLDLTKVGVSGHSQGGGGALMAGRDPRITALAPVMPYTARAGYLAGIEGQQHGPMLVLSGSVDAIAPPGANQQPLFEAAKTPVVWATLNGAGHLVPMFAGGVYPGIITAWFRWQLMGDAKAGAAFLGERCGYCVSTDWIVRRKGAL